MHTVLYKSESFDKILLRHRSLFEILKIEVQSLHDTVFLLNLWTKYQQKMYIFHSWPIIVPVSITFQVIKYNEIKEYLPDNKL